MLKQSNARSKTALLLKQVDGPRDFDPNCNQALANKQSMLAVRPFVPATSESRTNLPLRRVEAFLPGIEPEEEPEKESDEVEENLIHFNSVP